MNYEPPTLKEDAQGERDVSHGDGEYGEVRKSPTASEGATSSESFSGNLRSTKRYSEGIAIQRV